MQEGQTVNDDGYPCPTCRTVHQDYADDICHIERGRPTRHGYEMHIWNGCTCKTCAAGCLTARNRARRAA